MTFKVGDKVRWTSPRPRGAGVLEHSGVVIEVVPAGGLPRVKWLATSRSHESYLVQEDGKRREIFWPLVRWFKG